MIVVQLIGGLGNQLFQYAAGRALAEARQTIVKLDTSPFDTYKLHAYSLPHFNISATIASQSERALFESSAPLTRVRRLSARLRGDPYRKVAESAQFNYTPSLFPESSNLYLSGYWQTEKYFKDVAPMLRFELTVRTMPDPVSADLAVRIKQANAVCIHVRRADYVSDSQTHSVHGACSVEYYQAAMMRLTETVASPHYFVFSDDPMWARANLHFDHPATFVSHNQADRNYEDLRLMTLCKHFIIANSTFSWWGAWLGTNETKTVIAPAKWSKTADAGATDIIPPTWIRL